MHSIGTTAEDHGDLVDVVRHEMSPEWHEVQVPEVSSRCKNQMLRISWCG